MIEENFFQQYESLKILRNYSTNFNSFTDDDRIEVLELFSSYYEFMFDNGEEHISYDMLDELFYKRGIIIDSLLGETLDKLEGVKLSIDLYRKISRSHFWRIRYKIIQNFFFPKEILEEMTKDKDDYIKDSALARLANIS